MAYTVYDGRTFNNCASLALEHNVERERTSHYLYKYSPIYIFIYLYTRITQSWKLNVKGTKHNVGIKR